MELYTQEKHALRTGREKEPPVKLLQQINWGESYISLLLGIIVVAVVFVFVISVVRARRGEVSSINTENTETVSVTKTSGKPTLPSLTYTVLEGDDLSRVAEKYLGSGDLWPEIASLNNISNPDVLPAGMVLQIPQTKNNVTVQAVEESRIEQVSTEKITGNTYVVQEGDLLWEIAVRAYGDGFRWPDIVKANNLKNPDILSAGVVLRIPR